MTKEQDAKFTKEIITTMERAIRYAMDHWDMIAPDEANAFSALSMARNGATGRLERLPK